MSAHCVRFLPETRKKIWPKRKNWLGATSVSTGNSKRWTCAATQCRRHRGIVEVFRLHFDASDGDTQGVYSWHTRCQPPPFVVAADETCWTTWLNKCMPSLPTYCVFIKIHCTRICDSKAKINTLAFPTIFQHLNATSMRSIFSGRNLLSVFLFLFSFVDHFKSFS